VKRREFISLLGGATAAWRACSFAAFAQAATKRPRITFLGGVLPRSAVKNTSAFIEGMRALGYAEGPDFEMECSAARQPGCVSIRRYSRCCLLGPETIEGNY